METWLAYLDAGHALYLKKDFPHNNGRSQNNYFGAKMYLHDPHTRSQMETTFILVIM